MRYVMILLLLVLAVPALAQWEAGQKFANNTTGTGSYTTNNNAWAVAADGDNVHVVWFSDSLTSGRYDVFYKRSTNAGGGWNAIIRPDTNTANQYFPAVAASGVNVYVVWQDYRDPQGEIYLRRSTDNGTSFTEGEQLLSALDGYMSEAPSVAARGKYVWVVWDDSVGNGKYEIRYARSNNYGVTGSWTSGQVSSSGYKACYPSVAVVSNDAADTAHIVWQDNRDGSDRSAIYYDRYNALSQKGNTILSTSTANRYSLGPCVAAVHDSVFVAWTDNNATVPPSRIWNVWNDRSTNGGTTWIAAAAFTSNTCTYTELPNVAASGSKVRVVWDDDLAGASNFEIKYRQSTDKGLNWRDTTQLTNATGYSDYPSVAYGNNVVHVVWQDNFDGNYDVRYQRGWSPGWQHLTTANHNFGSGGWLTYNSSSNRIYALFGGGIRNFKAYNLTGGTWDSLATWPWETEDRDGSGCANGRDTIYVFRGQAQKNAQKYCAVNNQWVAIADIAENANLGTCMVYASVADKVCLLTGSGTSSTCALQVYDHGNNTWTTKATPLYDTAWHDGSWMAYAGGDTIYALQGTSNRFFKYSVNGNVWNATALAPMPGTTKPGTGGCAAYHDGKIYALKGNSTKEFWRYSIANNSWARMIDDAPLVPATGTSITTDGSYLYAEFANSTNTLWKYQLPPSGAFNPAPIEENASAARLGGASFVIAPNPLASGFATLRYNLPRAGPAEVSVYNVSGQMVLKQALVVGRQGSGVTLDLHQLRNGVYLVRLTSDGFAGTQKLVVRR
jgi:hypothetical protein